MTQLVDAYLGMMALRQSGYKSTAAALAELVDNSIESGAKKINIIAISREVMLNTRTSNQVQKLAVLDNGVGMDIDVLTSCLSLGWGTRLETREGLGRFGFGLKGSSLSQARRVEVYSWTKAGDVYMTYWDLDEIKEKKQQKLELPKKSKIPSEIKKNFEKNISKTGTLVVWDKLDQIDAKRSETLIDRINKSLCRTYRHFLDNDNTYGEKRAIWVHTVQGDTGECLDSSSLLANDPIYRLTPNNLPEYEKEATNEEFCKPFSIDIEYLDGKRVKKSKVEFRFTIAKPSIQELGGASKQGKHYLNNCGISFVRACREIDMGTFGFFDTSDYRHRWWGAEIRFAPVLDELFGVTSDKQHVRNIRKLDDDFIEAHADDIDGDYKLKMLIEINKIMKDYISDMMKIIKGRKEGSQKDKKLQGGLASKVNADVITDITPTESGDRAKVLTLEQKVKERVKLLLDDDETLTPEQAELVATQTINYRVDIQTGQWPGELFLDRRAIGNASVGIVNRNTQFYEHFWHYLQEHDDRKGFEALEVMMMALVRAEDELVKEYDKKIFDRFRQKWGSWIEKLIQHAGS